MTKRKPLSNEARRESYTKLAYFKIHKYTNKQCSEFLKVSPRTIDNWRKDPDYKRVEKEVRKDGKTYGYPTIKELRGELRRCTNCGDLKAPGDFKSYNRGKTILKHRQCLECENRLGKEQEKIIPLEQKQLNSFKRQGCHFTPEEYQYIVERSKGVCEICGNTVHGAGNRALCLDHDHKTKKLRGILCHHCNTALGHFKDNPKLLQKAIRYLHRDERIQKEVEAVTQLSQLYLPFAV